MQQRLVQPRQLRPDQSGCEWLWQFPGSGLKLNSSFQPASRSLLRSRSLQWPSAPVLAACRQVQRGQTRSGRIRLGKGGLIATFCYDIGEVEEASHLDIFQKTIVPAIAGGKGICSVRLLVADRVASGYVNAEQRARGAANLVPPIVLMVEGWADEDNFAKLLKNNLAPQTLAQHGLTGSSTLGIYAHQLTILRTP